MTRLSGGGSTEHNQEQKAGGGNPAPHLKNKKELNMTNLFENGRMIKLAAYNEDGLKLRHVQEDEGFAKLKFKGGLDEYNKVVELVNSQLDANEAEGKIWIYGTSHRASSVPSLAKGAKWALEKMGYKVKITTGDDTAGRMVTRGGKRQSEGAYKERYVTYEVSQNKRGTETMLEKKSDTVKRLLVDGNHRKALGIARNFRFGVSKDESHQMKLAYECIAYRGFYEQLGKNPDEEIKKGIDVLLKLFG